MKIKEAKKVIRKHFEWWVHWLGLGYWTLNIVISDDYKEKGDGYFLAGFCECDWKYQTAWVTMYPKAVQHLSDRQIEEAVLHELMHIFLNEMREGELHHEERVATSLQKAFSWLKYRDEEENQENQPETLQEEFDGSGAGI